MSLSPFNQWFFAARDDEHKVDGVGVPIGTALLYVHCHNDPVAFDGACKLLERAFDAGSARAVPPDWLPTAENVNALPEPIRRFVHELSTNADPAGTVRELAMLKDLARELAASNRMLRDQVAAVQAQGVPEHCDPSCTGYELAAMVMSDCGHSTNNQRLLDRIAARLDKHVESVLASAPPAPQAKQARKASADFDLPAESDAVTFGQDGPVLQEPAAVIGPAFQVLWTRQTPLEGLHVGDLLYTHPTQQVKPQPLSDELRQDLATIRAAEQWMFLTSLPVPSDVYAAFAQAIDNIEAAHGIVKE